jgi:hypothetical protein
MSFDINWDNYSASHPYLFQTHENKEGCDYWSKLSKRPMESTYTVEYDPQDPPYTKQEIEDLKYQLNTKYMSPSVDDTIPTLLFNVFFSEKNVADLQILVRRTVYNFSGHKIGQQSETTLLILMQTTYNESAKNVDESRAPKKLVNKHIHNQIKYLNSLVVDVAVPIIINEVEQYLVFSKQINQPLAELPRPMSEKITGTIQYREIQDVFLAPSY